MASKLEGNVGPLALPELALMPLGGAMVLAVLLLLLLLLGEMEAESGLRDCVRMPATLLTDDERVLSLVAREWSTE